MAAANHLLTEDELLGCICLDVFKDPVTLLCGHNFCKNCIAQHLTFNSQRQCPICKESVPKKYKLVVNTFISEISVRFRQPAGRKARDTSEQQDAQPGEASRDVPTGNKRTTMKFCLLLALGLSCLIFYTINLQLHQKHQQFVANNIRPKHGKPLELYCKNEQMPICRTCAVSSHRFHISVPLKQEYEMKKTELSRTEAEIQQKILERQVKNTEIKRWVLIGKDAVDREMAGGVRVFTSLIQSLERAQEELIGMIDAEQKMIEMQAKGFTKDLQEEITALQRRHVEVQQLLRSKDHLHFLQKFPSVNTVPLTKDLPKLSSCHTFEDGLLRTALATAATQLTETFRNEMERLQEAELKSVQQSAVDVTLDPDTAHPYLILSDDGKQVHCCGDGWNDVPDNPKRFKSNLFVLGKQSFCCGKFYFDVQVKGKSSWVLGVIQESVDRKGRFQLNPENGLWALFHMYGHQYFAFTDPCVLLPVDEQCERVRVFVDYDRDVVSFYNIDSATLIYSFTNCSFTEKLYPVFGPYTHDRVPLIVLPVNQ